MQSLFHQTHQPISSFPKSLRPSRKTILLILAVVAITLLFSIAISMWLARTQNLHIPGVGTIKTRGVEAYWDQDLTDEIDEDENIDWGDLWVGSSNNVTIYLQSISNIPTTLNLTTANLTFCDRNHIPLQPRTNISKYMNLTWDYNGSLVDPGDIIPVTLALSSTYSSDFVRYLIDEQVQSFSLVITIKTTE